MEEKKNSLLGGALWLAVSVVIVKLIGFFYKVPLSYILGDIGMSYFNSAYTVFTFFYMLSSAGVPKAVSILVSKKGAAEDREGELSVLFSSVKFFSVFGGALAILLAVFSPMLSVLIGNRPSVYSMLSIAPSLLFVCASGVLRGYLCGVGRLSPIAVAQVIEGVVKFVFGLALASVGYRLGLSYPIISALTILGVSLGSLATLLFFVNRLKIEKINEKQRQKIKLYTKNNKVLSSVIRLGVPLTVSAAIMSLGSIVDLGLIMRRLASGGFSETAAAELYGNFTTLVVPMLNLATALIAPLSQAALPLFSASFAARRGEDFRRDFSFFFELCALIAIPLGLGFLFFSEEILVLLFDDNSAKMAAGALSITAISIILLPLLTLVNTALEAASRSLAALTSLGVGVVVKIILSYTLIANPKIGILGAAISTAASYAVSLVISISVLLISARVKISVLYTICRPLFFSFICISMAKLFYVHLGFGRFDLPLLAFCAIFSVGIYLTLCVFSGVLNVEKMHKMAKYTKKS